MERQEAIKAVVEARDEANAALFVCNGLLSRAVNEHGDSASTYYLLGGMGLCAPTAAGFARRANVPVIAMEGDGNCLMGLCGSLVPRELKVARFVHVVFDNGVYESTGGQSRPGRRFDFCLHAQNAGYDEALAVASPIELAQTLARGLTAGRTFILCTVNMAAAVPDRLDRTPHDLTKRMRDSTSLRYSTGGAQ